ncbi:MAG: hypothetical protein R2791_19595 [Saprospiraceae bacterium]|nr:hypothetical protein [Saprospiraceae bacterium]
MQRLALRRGEVGDHDLCAGFGKGPAMPAADQAGGAGHDGGFVFKGKKFGSGHVCCIAVIEKAKVPAMRDAQVSKRPN